MRGVRGREEAAVYVFAQPVLSHPLPLARLDLGLRQAALHCLEAPVGLDRFHLGGNRELQQVAPPSDIRVLISARASGSLGVGSTNATIFFSSSFRLISLPTRAPSTYSLGWQRTILQS